MEIENNNPNSQKIDDYKEQKKLMLKITEYGTQRIDLLIISVSGAGIYLCLETVKFYLAKNEQINCSIKISAAFFLISIFFNILSQYLSINSSDNYYEYYCELLEEHPDLKKVNIYKKKATENATSTEILNYLSGATLTIGAIILFIFFIINV
jgi:hypothetical protein